MKSCIFVDASVVGVASCGGQRVGIGVSGVMSWLRRIKSDPVKKIDLVFLHFF